MARSTKKCSKRKSGVRSHKRTSGKRVKAYCRKRTTKRRSHRSKKTKRSTKRRSTKKRSTKKSKKTKKRRSTKPRTSKCSGVSVLDCTGNPNCEVRSRNGSPYCAARARTLSNVGGKRLTYAGPMLPPGMRRPNLMGEGMMAPAARMHYRRY